MEQFRDSAGRSPKSSGCDCSQKRHLQLPGLQGSGVGSSLAQAMGLMIALAPPQPPPTQFVTSLQAAM